MLSIEFNEKRLKEVVKEAISEVLIGVQKSEPKRQENKKLTSIRALADFLGCSVVTAQKLKNSNKIPFRQFNRKVIFDSDEVLKALNHNK